MDISSLLKCLFLIPFTSCCSSEKIISTMFDPALFVRREEGERGGEEGGGEKGGGTRGEREKKREIYIHKYLPISK